VRKSGFSAEAFALNVPASYSQSDPESKSLSREALTLGESTIEGISMPGFHVSVFFFLFDKILKCLVAASNKFLYSGLINISLGNTSIDRVAVDSTLMVRDSAVVGSVLLFLRTNNVDLLTFRESLWALLRLSTVDFLLTGSGCSGLDFPINCCSSNSWKLLPEAVQVHPLGSIF